MLPETVVLVALCAATITDLKTREVSDKVSYGLMGFGALWQCYLSYSQMSFVPLADGAAGFAVFFGLGYLLYRFNQWGGGDTKILGALGIVFGVKSLFMVSFFINLLFFGAVYGVIYAFYTALKYKGRIKYKKTDYAVAATIVCILLLVFGAVYFRGAGLKILFFAVVLLSYGLYFLLNFMEAVQKQAFQRYVAPSELTEGDWVAEDVKYLGRVVCSKNDNGLTLKQIAELDALYKKGRVKKVLLKEGIPFLPSFLAAFAASLLGLNIAGLVLAFV